MEFFVTFFVLLLLVKVSLDNLAPAAASQDSSPRHYGLYYSSGEYSRRYRSITRLARERIERLIDAHIALVGTQCPLTIIDYGCGNGRYFLDLVQIAESRCLSSVHIVGYDPTPDALLQFKALASEHGFFAGAPDGDDSATLSKDAVKLSLIEGSVDLGVDQVAALLPAADIILCLFGVLSHIPRRCQRQATLRMLRGKAATLVLSVPNVISNRSDYDLFEARRSRCCPDRDAVERGDIYYTREAVGDFFYHLYTVEEIEQDCEAAQWRVDQVGCATVAPETLLTTTATEEQRHADYEQSKSMARSMLDHMALYFWLECKAVTN